MTQRPLALAVALAIAASTALVGCDRTSNLSEQEHIQRAKDFEDKGKLKSSVVELKNAIQKNPDSPQARLLLGQIYLKLGQGAEAEKELRQAEKLGVNRETIKPQLGEALLLMGEYKQVLDEIEPGAQTSRANVARIYQIRADALLNQQNVEDACNLYQKSLAIDTANPPTYWGLAQCAVAERDLAKARAWLDSALKLPGRQAKTWILIGNLEQFNNKSNTALAAYTNALKAEPDNLEALQNRAAVNMALGQLETARADVERVTRLAPKSLPAHYLDALLNFEQGNYAESQASLQEVLKNTPDYMPGVLLAGATAYALGAYQQAESYLNRFLARTPGHGYARRVLAATQIKQSQPERSLETLAPLLAPGTGDAPALALAGQALLMKGEPQKATEYLQRAAAIDPENASIQTELGLSHLSAGENQLAIAELARAALLDPGQHKADSLLVMTLLNLKEYDKALAAIAALEKKIQNSAIIHTMRGNALLGKNDIPNARKVFEQALAIDPGFYPAAASLAQLDLLDKKPDAARKRFERILDKDKNNLQAMIALAELAAANKQEQVSIAWLEKAARAHPEAIAPRAILVRRHLTRNEPQKALAIANEAVNANPNNPAALDLLGSAQLASNDTVSATSTFTKLTQQTEQSSDALLRLALAQVASNKLADARNTLQKALKLKPDHAASLDALIRLEIKTGNGEKALQIARQVQQLLPTLALGFEREGDIHLYQKHPGPAVKAYEQALARHAGSNELIKLHRAHTQAGNRETANRYLNDWLRRHPDDLIVRAYAAENDIVNGRNREAIAQYQAILRQNPENPLVLNNLAGLYQREADPRALATAEQALRLAPQSPTIQDTLGWILVEQGQAQRGLELLRKALAKAAKNETIRYHHAIALARTGDKAGARKELERLLRSAPDFPQAEAAKAQLNTL